MIPESILDMTASIIGIWVKIRIVLFFVGLAIVAAICIAVLAQRSLEADAPDEDSVGVTIATLERHAIT